MIFIISTQCCIVFHQNFFKIRTKKWKVFCTLHLRISIRTCGSVWRDSQNKIIDFRPLIVFIKHIVHLTKTSKESNSKVITILTSRLSQLFTLDSDEFVGGCISRICYRYKINKLKYLLLRFNYHLRLFNLFDFFQHMPLSLGSKRGFYTNCLSSQAYCLIGLFYLNPIFSWICKLFFRLLK